MSSMTGASSVEAATSVATPSSAGARTCSTTGWPGSAALASALIEAVSVGAFASTAAVSPAADSAPAPKRLLSSSARVRTAAASRLVCSARVTGCCATSGSRRRHFAGRLHDRGVALVAEMGAPGILQIGETGAVEESRHRESRPIARRWCALLIDLHAGSARDEARRNQHAEQTCASVGVHTLYPPTETAGCRRPEGAPLISTCRTISVPPTQCCPQLFCKPPATRRRRAR